MKYISILFFIILITLINVPNTFAATLDIGNTTGTHTWNNRAGGRLNGTLAGFFFVPSQDIVINSIQTTISTDASCGSHSVYLQIRENAGLDTDGKQLLNSNYVICSSVPNNGGAGSFSATFDTYDTTFTFSTSTTLYKGVQYYIRANATANTFFTWYTTSVYNTTNQNILQVKQSTASGNPSQPPTLVTSNGYIAAVIDYDLATTTSSSSSSNITYTFSTPNLNMQPIQEITCQGDSESLTCDYTYAEQTQAIQVTSGDILLYLAIIIFFLTFFFASYFSKMFQNKTNK